MLPTLGDRKSLETSAIDRSDKMKNKLSSIACLKLLKLPLAIASASLLCPATSKLLNRCRCCALPASLRLVKKELFSIDLYRSILDRAKVIQSGGDARAIVEFAGNFQALLIRRLRLLQLILRGIQQA